VAQLQFKGKSFVQNHHLSVKYHQLVPDKKKSLGPFRGKKCLVFAPAKYLDAEYLLELRIDFCQLPFEIYRFKG